MIVLLEWMGHGSLNAQEFVDLDWTWIAPDDATNVWISILLDNKLFPPNTLPIRHPVPVKPGDVWTPCPMGVLNQKHEVMVRFG